uniref:Thyrotropin-releasing hormone receptor n=1 Tax=Echinococcus canadensis TaxID=519352 RepID=A0A915EVH6_9CEST
MRCSMVYRLHFILFHALSLGLLFAMHMQIALRLYKFRIPICLMLDKEKSESSRNVVRGARHGGPVVLHWNRQDTLLSTETEIDNFVQKHRYVVKTLMAVVVLFAVFSFPYRTLMEHNSLVTPKRTDYWLILFIKTTARLNSTVNPILYNAMSKKFRRAFSLLITQSKDIICLKISNLPKQIRRMDELIRRKMNSVLGNQRTKCTRLRDHFHYAQQQRHQLSLTAASLTQGNELQSPASNDEVKPWSGEDVCQ